MCSYLPPTAPPHPDTSNCYSPEPVIHLSPAGSTASFFPTDFNIHMLIYKNPACHLRPVRARQVFRPEVIIKRCVEDGKGGGMGVHWGGIIIKMGI